MDVSVVIPARNEVHLAKTIDMIFAAARAETEIIAVLDGYWPEPMIEARPNLIILHNEVAIGQRASINFGAGEATGKYILKTDAHSMMDEGFDVKLMADCEYDWTVIPRMYNLDIEKWAPKKHKKTDYMFMRSPAAKEKPLRSIYWDGPTAREFHEEYKAYKERIQNAPEIDDVMTGQGACFFMHMERFWELGGMDEAHGSWGAMGIEVALKAWLSGGRLVVNKKTWFSHLFRGGSGPGFPYPISGKEQDTARKYAIEFWTSGKWDKQIRPIEWLVEKFAPVPTWGVNMPSILTLKDKFKGKTCNIVARGPSVQHINGTHLADGPVIAINDAIETVGWAERESEYRESMQVFSMQKDRAFAKPNRRQTLLVSEQQTKNIHPEVTKRYAFDTKMWFGDRDEFSANCAIKIAQEFGCTKIRFISFDHCTHGDHRNYVGGKIVPHDKGKYEREKMRMMALVEEDKLDVEFLRPMDRTEEFRKMDYRHIITKQRYPRWMGHKIIKHPTDLILYHQAIFKNKPDTIIETGTRFGGSAMFYASMLDLIGKGQVISVDIAPLHTPPHPRITYINGSSKDPAVVEKVKSLVSGACMVTLDSDHTRQHVKWELKLYSPMVTRGQYLVVEDCYTRGRNKQHGPGQALDWFMTKKNDFEQTNYDAQFLSTITRGGWLIRR